MPRVTAAMLGRLEGKVDEWAARRFHLVERPEPLPLLEWTRKYLGGVLTMEPSPFHQWLCATLDGLKPGDRVLTQAARGLAKSTFASFAYPLREALEGRQPFTLILSDTGKQARRFIRQIRREVEANELLRRDYGPACASGAVWRDDWLSLPNGCEITAIGSGGRVRGVKSAGNRRPTAIVLDDVQRKEHVVSALQRERLLEWLNMDVMPAGEPGTRFFCVGTPMHREDVVCTLERTAGWTHRRWPALIEMPKRLDLWREFQDGLHTYDVDDAEREARADDFYAAHREQMDEGAMLAWGERFPLLALMKLRAAMGEAAFSAEYQCVPVDPASCFFPAEYFDHPNLFFTDWPTDLVIRTVALDPSIGRDAKRGDYSAIVRHGRDRFGVNYFEADVARRPVDVMCHDLARHCKEFNPHGVGVETNCWQELLVVPIQAAARALGVELPIFMQNHSTAKVVRIRQLGTPLAQKRVRFKARSPGTQLLIQQLRDAPTGHDDAPDAAQAAWELASLMLQGKVVLPKRR